MRGGRSSFVVRPPFGGERAAREAMKSNLRDHPGFGGGGFVDRPEGVDACVDLRERQHVELAERAGPRRGERAELLGRIGLDEPRIGPRAVVGVTEPANADVLLTQLREILLGDHGAIVGRTMTDKRREVDELRQEILKLDASLRSVLERRAKLSKKIGELRKSVPSVVALPDRAQIEQFLQGATGDVPPAALREIYREVLATCLSLEEPVVVAYAGLEGAFAHAAARSRFGVAASFTACETTSAALDEVTRQRANYAVVPYETRTDGLLQSTIVSLTESDLKVVLCFETVVNLQLATKASSLAEIEKVYVTAGDRVSAAHFLEAELASAQIVDVRTPMAACQLAASDPRTAALAHESIAAEHGLEILRRNVRDEGEERVRYAVVGSRPAARSGDDATALVFAVDDSPGALHEVLRQFAERGVNLTKIQSRPTPSASWQYLFFVEVQGHATDRPIIGALEELRRRAKFFKVLGSFPSA